MARTMTPVKRVTTAGLTWVTADLITPDTTNGNWAPNDGATYLYFAADGSARTFTVVTPATLGGLAVADLGPVTVPASGWGMAGPFPREVYGPQVLFDVSNAALKCLVLSWLPETRF